MKCPIDELLSYLTEKQVSNKIVTSKTLSAHIALCTSCNELVNDTRLGEIFLKANKFASEVDKVIKNTFPISERNTNEVKPGTICSFRYNESKKFALIVSEITTDENLSDKLVRIMPILPNPNYYDYSEETDCVIPAEDNILGLKILIEWWNERPILLKQLDMKFGELSEKALNRLSECQLQESDAELTENQKLFRTQEIEIGKLYSEALFNGCF